MLGKNKTAMYCRNQGSSTLQFLCYTYVWYIHQNEKKNKISLTCIKLLQLYDIDHLEQISQTTDSYTQMRYFVKKTQLLTSYVNISPLKRWLIFPVNKRRLLFKGVTNEQMEKKLPSVWGNLFAFFVLEFYFTCVSLSFDPILVTNESLRRLHHVSARDIGAKVISS